MDVAATGVIWLVVMAIVSLGGALGGVAAVYFADKHLGGRPGSKYTPKVDQADEKVSEKVSAKVREYEAAA